MIKFLLHLLRHSVASDFAKFVLGSHSFQASVNQSTLVGPINKHEHETIHTIIATFNVVIA